MTFLIFQLGIVVFSSIILKLSVLTIGGILLVLGSYWISEGDIRNSTIFYTLADFMWLYNAYNNN